MAVSSLEKLANFTSDPLFNGVFAVARALDPEHASCSGIGELDDRSIPVGLDLNKRAEIDRKPGWILRISEWIQRVPISIMTDLLPMGFSNFDFPSGCGATGIAC